ncbi:hypothetical protein GYMLUDRAFT_247708 [Collybiopsis luxurians FD-317 M1]|uniref:PABS domain-containing protein n=1 Tax=Collybiopsis luxurians FD-317 M1 TaxID=944289 RepID=A0A0D0CN61_9AGAR|nr:hypothetical protein GYMLUDRAFT_247708 [Collybiopsis luxurians FD-317 M1]
MVMYTGSEICTSTTNGTHKVLVPWWESSKCARVIASSSATCPSLPIPQSKLAGSDVLVFEGQTYGNVLVLDGVIQCTERDEFSYQEMTTHFPMVSHANPENVLVIGEGDSGVVRESLNYDSVKQVVLCDIDEGRSSCLQTMDLLFPDLTKSLYDIIITDSSDPVDPAAFLSRKPYHQLLYDALRPGRHISAQGVSDPESVKGPGAVTRYWNSDVHRAAFILHGFGRVALGEDKDLRPQIDPEVTLKEEQKKKRVLLGSGHARARRRCKTAGIAVLNKVGLYPGIDHLYAVKTIDEVHAKGGKVKEFISCYSGLPAPVYASNPAGHLAEPCSLSSTTPLSFPTVKSRNHYYISPAYAFVAYPNDDSTPFRDLYSINDEGEGGTCIRCNLRYQGFPEFIKALVLAKMLNIDETDEASHPNPSHLEQLRMHALLIPTFSIPSHRFVAEWPDQSVQMLEAYGLTGGIATPLMLDGRIWSRSVGMGDGVL